MHFTNAFQMWSMTGQMAYSFIKAIIRNEQMFNCYYLHNYHLTTGPYFKMVRKVKAVKKPGIREILLLAMAGRHWYKIPKRLRIRQKIKWGAEVPVGWKVAAEGSWGLQGTSFFQTVTEWPLLQFPRIRIRIRIRVERVRKTNHTAALVQGWKGSINGSESFPKHLARRNVINCFTTLSLAHQKIRIRRKKWGLSYHQEQCSNGAFKRKWGLPGVLG